MINVSGLTRRFRAKTALASVSVWMPRGAVYGLVGANGAGKTTLIEHILGLLRAQGGSVRVLGLDPVADLRRPCRQVRRAIRGRVDMRSPRSHQNASRGAMTVEGAPHDPWNYPSWFPDLMGRSVAFFTRTLVPPQP